MDVWDAFYVPNAGYAQELYERFAPAARRATWVNMRTCKFQDGGYRAKRDYDRFALAISQVAAMVKADIFPLSLTGSACQYCDHRNHCGGMGLADPSEGDPSVRQP